MPSPFPLCIRKAQQGVTNKNVIRVFKCSIINNDNNLAVKEYNPRISFSVNDDISKILCSVYRASRYNSI